MANFVAMKFTKYFAGVIRNQGIPQISVNEYQKLFNIITLKCRLDELYKLKDIERNQDRKYSLDIRIFQIKEQFHRLTMENTPQNLLKYMMIESKFDS